ncbi:MAG: SPOR domain-containing protein [Chitinophagales bacterium]
MKYLLRITILIICFPLISFSLQAQHSQYYSVQLGAFKKPDMNAFAGLKDVGTIYEEQTKSGLTRILLGTYAKKTEADASLKVAQANGFTSAFVIRRMVEIKEEKPEPITPEVKDDVEPEEEDIITVSETYDEEVSKEEEKKEEAEKKEPVVEKPIEESHAVLPDEVYVVQLAAFKSDIPKKDFEGLSKQASIYKNNAGDWTRVVLGAKEKVEDAKALIEAAKKAGYEKAFVKKVASKTLELLFLTTPTKTEEVIPAKGNKKPVIDENEDDLIKVDNEGEDIVGTEGEIMVVDERKEESGEEAAKPLPMSEKIETMTIANIDLIDEINCIGCNEAEDKIVIEGTIFPINNDNLLLEGRMAYTGDMYSQTMLLSSKDGGKNWKQVVAPDFGYEILHLDFVDEKVGYLINFWVVEGAGDLKLYKTIDSGQSWNFVSAIPKNDFLCLPLITQFTDERNGLIIYECDVPEPGYYAWSTINGGQKWVSIGSITEEDYDAFLQNAADTKRKKELSSEEFTNIMGDSSWKQEMTDDYIIIYRVNEKGVWEETSRLKRNYQKIDGKIEALGIE